MFIEKFDNTFNTNIIAHWKIFFGGFRKRSFSLNILIYYVHSPPEISE